LRTTITGLRTTTSLLTHIKKDGKKDITKVTPFKLSGGEIKNFWWGKLEKFYLKIKICQPALLPISCNDLTNLVTV